MGFLWYPLICGFIYPISVLIIKQVMPRFGGVWRVTFVSNLAMAAVVLPWMISAPAPTADAVWWQPFISGCVFWLGQVFTFLALSKGDASVATPLMGTKVIFVALLTVFLMQQMIPLRLWMAAGLTSLALLLLCKTGKKPNPDHHQGITAIYAFLSALCFALTDVLTQKFTPFWGVRLFAPLIFLVLALLSFSFIPFFKGKFSEAPARSWILLLAASVLLAGVGLAMCYVIGTYGQATVVNVVYNSRGMFSVIIVWAVGHWFGSRENEVGHRVMGWRLAGAILLLSAIGLVAL